MGLKGPANLTKPSRRWLMIGAVGLVQLLLMGSAFVGGRMWAQQGVRRGGGGFQLPSELPREPAAGTGSVQKIQDSVFTITPGFGFGGPGRSQQADTTPIDVTTSAETKFYKNTSTGGGFAPGGPTGGQSSVQISAAALTDVKVGNQVIVWGTKSGSRITADVVYIQAGGR